MFDIRPTERCKKEFKVFISQPMSGLTPLDIKIDRIIGKYLIRDEFMDTFLGDNRFALSFIDDSLQEDKDPKLTHPLEYLGYDISLLKDADVIYFLPGWEKSKGCNIEYQVAKFYNIPMEFINSNNFSVFKSSIDACDD